jgi:hypothetical protein
MKKKLERKRFRIRDEKGNYIGKIGAVSMVTRPAIEKSFELFSDEVLPKKLKFEVTDMDKMEITGPIMSANKDIIRYDYENECYYFCYFSEQDVVDYRDYFMQFADTRQSNFEHSEDYLKDFFLTESWIVVDAKCDKATALGFKEVENADWYGTFKCTNPKLWAELKESDFSGFSIEIELDYFSELKLEKELEAILEDITLTKEEKKEKIRAIVFKTEQK